MLWISFFEGPCEDAELLDLEYTGYQAESVAGALAQVQIRTSNAE